MDKLHASARRLLDHAQRVTAGSHEPVTSLEDVARLMRLKQGVMTNWKARGVSGEGAIAAEKKFGCSPTWILTGTAGGEIYAARPAAQTAQAQPSIHDSLWRVAEAAERIADTETRRDIAALVELVVSNPAMNAADQIPIIVRRLSGESGQAEGADRPRAMA